MKHSQVLTKSHSVGGFNIEEDIIMYMTVVLTTKTDQISV